MVLPVLREGPTPPLLLPEMFTAASLLLKIPTERERERESGATPLPPCVGWVQCVPLGGFSFVGQPGLRVLTPRASSALGLAIEDSLPLLFLPFLGQRDVVDGRVPPSCVVVVRAMAFPPSRNIRPAKEGGQVSDGNVVRQCLHAEVPVLGDEYRFTVQLHRRIRFPWKYMVNTVLA